jgi:formate dehydrogenase major subunit
MNDELNPGILSSSFHFPEMMLNLITSGVSDSLAIPQARDRSCPEYKVVCCRIRKPKKAHLTKAEEVIINV